MEKSVGFFRINFEIDHFDISSINCAPEFTNENAWVDPKDLERGACSILLTSFEEGHILGQEHQSNV